MVEQLFLLLPAKYDLLYYLTILDGEPKNDPEKLRNLVHEHVFNILLK